MKLRNCLWAGLAAIAVGLIYLGFHYSRLSPARVDAAAKAPTAVTPSANLPTNARVLALNANSDSGTNIAIQVPARESDLTVNPYAAGLREPGKSKRTWEAGFLQAHQASVSGTPIQFELTEGRMANGTVLITQFRDGQLNYMSGKLTEPEAGTFFFLTPPLGGRAGKAVGVVEFPASKTAYRIEPTGPNGDPELWQRRLDEVVCVSLPQPLAAATNTMEMPPLRPDLVPGDYVPSYNSNVVSLQSLPGSPAVLLLDFFGGYTPTWGGVNYVKPANISNATIKDLWKRVAEDYMPFNINVTTDIEVYRSASETSRQKCCYTDTPVTAAGVAYFGSWNWGGDTPCWSVYTTGKSGAEVGSHEAGHTLGLSHDGQKDSSGTTTNEYYGGQGSGPTGWAPIMGVGYYQPVATWSKGEYQSANNTQDQLNIITTANNSVTYRVDDTGSTLGTSRYLEVYPDFSVMAEGVIERTHDTDAFQFTTTGGQISLTARPVGDWADLAMIATLADNAGLIIASNNPQSTLYATIATNLPAGTYTFNVTGAGRNNPLTTGFTDYASLGYYSIVGSVAGARLSTRLSVAEHSPVDTIVGTVPATNQSDVFAYSIVSGNTGNTFSIDADGVVRVANNSQLDYAQLAANSPRSVQFELMVNIADITDPALTELNRRVIVSVLSSALNYPVAVSGFNAGVIVPYNATLALPKATAFDIPNNFCFYQAGLNGNPQVGGSGGLQGLPANGVVLGQADNSTFQLGPYGASNALLMGNGYPAFGTLTLATPRAYNSISILASSANGGGVGTFVLNFTNGTKSQVFNFNAQDWYNVVTNVGIQGFGRVRLGQGTFNTEDPGGSNPNLYQTTINLGALGLNREIASISFTNPLVGGSRVSGIFAVSGSPMPPQVNITRQPVSTTNNNPSLAASFSVVAMGDPTVGYQWYNGNPGSGTLLPGKTATNLVLNPVQASDAGNYYVVVTNSLSSATSAVATLTVFRAPQIVQQPSPTNFVLFAGQKFVSSVVANAALPVSYYWRTNGTLVPGGTSATLTVNNLQLAQSGNYSLLVSNAYGMATSSVVSLTVVAPTYPYAQLVLAHKPVGYWRLDEASGTIAHDYAGGNNGTFNNTQLGQPGNNLVDTHKAAKFGVLSSFNSYVGNIPIDFGTITNGTFSVEAWLNGGAQTTDAGIITRGTGAGGEQFNLDCGAGGHAFRFFVRDLSSGNAHLANGTIAPNGQWHHVVGVCDQVNGLVVLYVDGVSNASSTITAGSGILMSANPMSIGSRQAGTTTYNNQFIGTMEEVAVYNYALSAAQVQAHYGAVTNRPPVFVSNPFGKPNANAGQFYSTSMSTNATDPNGDSVTYAKVSGPAWLSVSSGGAISGTPANVNANTNTFVVSARDSLGASNTATLNIYVNGSPSFTSNPFLFANLNVGDAFSGSLAGFASDPNPGDTLTFAKVSGPAWLSIASDGSVSGIPSAADLNTNSFQVSVTDAASLSGTATMYVYVNGAPVFTSDPILKPSVAAGQSYISSISGDATDPNSVETLSFAKISGPNWLNVASNGDLSGTPVAGDVGPNSLVVRVTDSHSLSDQANLNLTVTPGGIVASISSQGNSLLLQWTGGNAPYQVQQISSLADGTWENLGDLISSNSISITTSNSAMFYRIQGQ